MPINRNDDHFAQLNEVCNASDNSQDEFGLAVNGNENGHAGPNNVATEDNVPDRSVEEELSDHYFLPWINAV